MSFLSLFTTRALAAHLSLPSPPLVRLLCLSEYNYSFFFLSSLSLFFTSVQKHARGSSIWYVASSCWVSLSSFCNLAICLSLCLDG